MILRIEGTGEETKNFRKIFPPSARGQEGKRKEAYMRLPFPLPCYQENLTSTRCPKATTQTHNEIHPNICRWQGNCLSHPRR